MYRATVELQFPEGDALNDHGQIRIRIKTIQIDGNSYFTDCFVKPGEELIHTLRFSFNGINPCPIQAVYSTR